MTLRNPATYSADDVNRAPRILGFRVRSGAAGGTDRKLSLVLDVFGTADDVGRAADVVGAALDLRRFDDRTFGAPGSDAVHETTADLLDRLAEFLDEAHAAEIEGDHEGDADHTGPAPEVCSYCAASEAARERADALRGIERSRD